MIIDKKTFCEILKRLEDYNKLQDNINDLFKNQIDNRENDFLNAGSICIGHESVVIKLLDTMFTQKKYFEKYNQMQNMVEYWAYELDYGKKYTIDNFEVNGQPVDISTSEKLYDYLIGEMEDDK